MEEVPPKLDYAGSPDIKLMPERRWLGLAVLVVLVVLLVAFYLLPMPGLIELAIFVAVFLVLTAIVILTVFIFVFGKLDERKSRINSRSGFPVGFAEGKPSVDEVPPILDYNGRTGKGPRYWPSVVFFIISMLLLLLLVFLPFIGLFM